MELKSRKPDLWTYQSDPPTANISQFLLSMSLDLSLLCPKSDGRIVKTIVVIVTAGVPTDLIVIMKSKEWHATGPMTGRGAPLRLRRLDFLVGVLHATRILGKLSLPEIPFVVHGDGDVAV